MRVDKDEFIKLVDVIAKHGGGCAGPWSKNAAFWCVRNRIPAEIRDLFETHMPKKEISAGAGVLFDELNIISWNNNFPEAVDVRLLIVGSAANGDHIAVDLDNGATGYISHEHDWRSEPREHFLAVSPSIGAFLRDINRDPPAIPEDYWDALNARS